MIQLLFQLLLLFLPAENDFRTKQKTFSRVKKAYELNYSSAQDLFKMHDLVLGRSEIFIRVHKLEKQLELWGKNKNDRSFRLIKTYDVCALSGTYGPKRMMGDLQTPEGFYYIDRFNPSSSYHLSLGINYPNKCDRANCKGKNPGGDIFIHGKCVTIGCLPLTDEKIEELYVIAVEARNGGQQKIPVWIFPTRMSQINSLLKKDDAGRHSEFWKNLKTGYDLFEARKELPSVKEGAQGSYEF